MKLSGLYQTKDMEKISHYNKKRIQIDCECAHNADDCSLCAVNTTNMPINNFKRNT